MNQLTEALDYLKRSLAIKERISLDVDTDHGLLNNRTWTGNGIENRRARVQRQASCKKVKN